MWQPYSRHQTTEAGCNSHACLLASLAMSFHPLLLLLLLLPGEAPHPVLHALTSLPAGITASEGLSAAAAVPLLLLFVVAAR
jgi:hypothetical protein